MCLIMRGDLVVWILGIALWLTAACGSQQNDIPDFEPGDFYKTFVVACHHSAYDASGVAPGDDDSLVSIWDYCDAGARNFESLSDLGEFPDSRAASP